MTKQNQSFRLKIIDHFDDIINQIDIKTETLFLDQSLTKKTREKLNEIREEQIEKIREIKEINLNLLNNDKETKDLEQEEEVEISKEKLIHFDCALIEQPKSLNGFNLWITSWFCNQKDLEFLR